MPRRIEIELTSHTGGTWTWRAAGAKLPKGTLPGDLVPGPATVGDVLRAEVESGLEGLEIVSLAPPPTKAESPPSNRIEVIGAPKRAPDVMVSLVPGARRRRDGPPRGEGGPRRDGPPRGEGGPRREPRRDGGPRREGPGENVDRRRMAASTVHRNAMLAALGPEQLPVAEQLLRGGIPAVRQAIAEQNKAAGGAAANADPLLAIAEQLLPAVNLATWKDRAGAAQAAGKDLRLRELRAVVTASRTVILDEEGRELAKALRAALDHRVTALRDDWVSRIGGALDGGRALEALRTATHPPEPAMRLPAELAVRISESAGTAMTAELDPADWLALLGAVLDSPVRRTVKPTGIPPAPDTLEAARHAAGMVPELAKLLGLRIPPPPPRRVLRLSPTGGAGRADGP